MLADDHVTPSVPKHVAIICDGNRRWARKQGLKVFKGHEFAVEQTVDTLIQHAQKRGIAYLTFWVFSTENWDRDAAEIDFLMNLFRKAFTEKIQTLEDRNVRLRAIGNLVGLAPDLQEKIAQAQEKTKNKTGITVTMAINYGGRDEIVRAVKKLVGSLVNARNIEDLDEKKFGQFLDTAGTPDPDLIIRTSGEQRLSGFMSWQQQYSEFYFTQVEFPDFNAVEFDRALEEFARRERRFGGG